MVGYSSASDDQKDSVRDMIKMMMNPNQKPDDMSFTMKWDVVASYSEAQINKLLADRHRKKGNGLLQELVFSVEAWNDFDEEAYIATYSVKFGPPLLQFDSEAMALPQCSIQMEILSGTTKFGEKGPKNIAPGWSLQLNNIPLASARGEMSDAGDIQGNPELIPGTKPVKFDYGQEQTQHVVLDFKMNQSKIVVVAIPPSGMDMDMNKHVATQAGFQKAFKEFFVGKPDEKNQPPRSFSYSIASVNNKLNAEAVELTPTKFQFATYFGDGVNKDMRLISIFVQVAGGPGEGQDEALQEGWKTQWYKNSITPIPRGFSASLIISSKIFNEVIMSQGLKKSNWVVKDVSAKGDGGTTKMECRSQEHWNVPEQNHHFPSGSSIFHVDSFSLSLKEWPLTLTIKQDDARASPNIYVWWELKNKVHWETTSNNLFGTRTTDEQGYLNCHYRLCDGNDFSNPRKLDSEIRVSDTAIDLNINLDTNGFRMDQPEPNGCRYDIWEKGMVGLYSKAPKVSISAFGIGFLRTTNLLMPGENVIDFNEEIGARVPKDLVLVGDVESIQKKVGDACHKQG